MFFVLLFHVVCTISNSNKWTAKHLAQASCTELTLIKAPLAPQVGNDLKESPLQDFIKGTLGPNAMMSRPVVSYN